MSFLTTKSESFSPMRFTIRDVLWLTVVVALGAGWFVDHSDMTKRVAAGKYNAMTPRGPLWVNFELCGVVRRVHRGQSLTITVTEDGGVTYNEPPP